MCSTDTCIIKTQHMPVQSGFTNVLFKCMQTIMTAKSVSVCYTRNVTSMSANSSRQKKVWMLLKDYL